MEELLDQITADSIQNAFIEGYKLGRKTAEVDTRAEIVVGIQDIPIKDSDTNALGMKYSAIKVAKGE